MNTKNLKIFKSGKVNRKEFDTACLDPNNYISHDYDTQYGLACDYTYLTEDNVHKHDLFLRALGKNKYYKTFIEEDGEDFIYRFLINMSQEMIDIYNWENYYRWKKV